MRTLRCRLLLAAALVLGAHAALPAVAPRDFQFGAGPVLRVWTVGSPHDADDVPAAHVPASIRRQAAKHGIAVTIAAFPARDFAAVFFTALERKMAPDVLVISNYGVIEGMSVGGEKFVGIAEDPSVREDLTQVTGAFDAFLGPARGWTFVFSRSPNHEAARRFALSQSACPQGFSDNQLPEDLREVVGAVVPSYLKANHTELLAQTDPARLGSDHFVLAAQQVGTVRPCAAVGNGRLQFVLVDVSYEADGKIGHAPVGLVFRRPFSAWQLLVAARDPVTTGRFMKEIASIGTLLEDGTDAQDLPAPASLLAPPDGQLPIPTRGQRFGVFTWHPSASPDLAFEIGEFAYKNDARLFLRRPRGNAQPDEISAGTLWTTRDSWRWRIWTVTRAGGVVFSDSRTFIH